MYSRMYTTFQINQEERQKEWKDFSEIKYNVFK